VKIKLKENIQIEADENTLEAIVRKCTYQNPKYSEAERMGRSVRTIDPLIHLSNETENGLSVPIGMLNKLLKQYPNAQVTDHRQTVKALIPFKGDLRPYQRQFVDDAVDAQSGAMLAATGAGKTIAAIALASHLKQRTLVLVKSKDLAIQWHDQIKHFTGCNAGLVGNGKNIEGEQFTVGLIQTLSKLDMSKLNYGLVIADECHNLPANQAFKVVNGINCKYKYGLTATLQRRDNMEFMIRAAIGEIAAEVKQEQLENKVLPVKIRFIEHDFYERVTFVSWSDYINIIAYDETRNEMIIEEVVMSCYKKPTIILCSTVKHCEILTELADYESLNPLLIHGQLPAKVRQNHINKAHNSSLIIGTSQLLSEGCVYWRW